MKTYYWMLAKHGAKRKLTLTDIPPKNIDYVQAVIVDKVICGGNIKIDNDKELNSLLGLLWAANPQLEIDLNIEGSQNELD